MLKKFTLALTLITIIILNPAFFVSAETSGEFTEGAYTYTVKDGKAALTGYSANGESEIIIPTEIGGYPVVSLGYQLYAKNTDVQKIVIPDTLEDIGEHPFYGCYNISEFEVSPESQYFTVQDNILYSKDMTTLHYYPATRTEEEFTVPDGVVFIDFGAFSGVYSLKNINLPDSLETIGEWAFSYCSFESVTIPENVTKIQLYGFAYCKKLQSVTFNGGGTQLGMAAFGGCSSLLKIELPENTETIPQGAFDSCVSLSEVIIPYGVREILSGAFAGCNALSEIEIPSSVTFIDENALGYNYNSQHEFIKSALFTIKAKEGSGAQSYAVSNGLKFISTGKVEEETQPQETGAVSDDDTGKEQEPEGFNSIFIYIAIAIAAVMLFSAAFVWRKAVKNKDK